MLTTTGPAGGSIAGMGHWATLAEIAAAQSGLVAAWQAAEVGINRQTLANRARAEGWQRAVRGVYLMPGHTLAPLQQITAVQLALRGRSLASHRTAAFLWDLTPRLYRPVEFIVPPDTSLRVAGAQLRRCRVAVMDDRRLRRGVWTSAPALTLCQLSAVWSVTQLASGIATAHRLRLTTPGGVEAVADWVGRFAGCHRLRAALRQLQEDGLVHSGWERMARQALREGGFVPHPKPYVVEDDTGFVAELDIAFPEWKVGIPIDGPHHLEADQRRADEDQRLRLRLLGWLLVPADIVRITEQRAVFLRDVERALRKQGWSR